MNNPFVNAWCKIAKTTPSEKRELYNLGDEELSKHYTPAEIEKQLDKLDEDSKSTLAHWYSRGRVAELKKDYGAASKAYSNTFECIDGMTEYVGEQEILDNAKESAQKAGKTAVFKALESREKAFYDRRKELNKAFDSAINGIVQ